MKDVSRRGGETVPAHATPGWEVGANARRGASAARARAKRPGGLSNRAAHVQGPAVFELHMRIGVGGALGRQPVRRPVLPPIEVPEPLLENQERLQPVE